MFKFNFLSPPTDNWAMMIVWRICMKLKLKWLLVAGSSLSETAGNVMVLCHNRAHLICTHISDVNTTSYRFRSTLAILCVSCCFQLWPVCLHQDLFLPCFCILCSFLWVCLSILMQITAWKDSSPKQLHVQGVIKHCSQCHSFTQI